MSPLIYHNGLKGRTIRLLTVKPGDLDSPLECTLAEAPLDDPANSYNALSYCWGTKSSPVQIMCNAQPLLITSNLHTALHEYRRRAINVPLWVDAICIDQSNTSERTSQVRMMQTIYSKATCVVVWLGEAESTDSMALELLEAMNAPWAMFPGLHFGSDLSFLGYFNIADHDAKVAAQVPDVYFDALAAFLMRPWFSRIWMCVTIEATTVVFEPALTDCSVQELICAKQLIIWCGAETLNEKFPILEAASRLFQMYNCNIKTQLATVVLEDKEAQETGRSKLMCAGRLWGFKSLRDSGLSGIQLLLLITRCFDATDPRDKIFALVGLANDIGEEFVDYSKSYDAVVQELSQMILDGSIEAPSGSVLDMWSCITRDENDDLLKPSWVVDWVSLKVSLYTPLIGQYESERPFITRSPEILLTTTGQNTSLQVRGTVFDTIASIVPSPIAMRQLVPQSDFLTSKHVPGIFDWHGKAMTAMEALAPSSSTGATPVYSFTGEALHEAFWRTLCCNRSSSNTQHPPADDSSYRAWRKLFQLQTARHKLELTFRRVCKIGKISFWGISCLSISILTYCFRRNKFLFCAVPFALPSMIQFTNTAWDVCLRTLLVKLHNDHVQQTSQTQIDQRDFENSFSLWTQGRQFGISAQGLIGWVPLAARVGDDVGLFAGCRIPYILRAHKEGYKIVGDTYLHGVMNGEGDGSDGELINIV